MNFSSDRFTGSAQTQRLGEVWSFASVQAIVIFWVMPPFGLLVTLVQVPELKYLRENSTIAMVLSLTVFLQFFWGRRRFPNVRATASAAGCLTIILGIEWLHFLAGRATIDQLTDIRMLVYSPFYGSIILFFLYSMFLSLMNDVERIQHLKIFVVQMSVFHIFFLVCFALFFLDLVPEIPRTQIINMNSLAYSAVFVLLIVLLFQQLLQFSIGLNLFSIAAAAALVIAIQSRGAMLTVLILIGFLFVQRIFKPERRRQRVFAAIAVIIVLGLGFLLKDGLMSALLGNDYMSIPAFLSVMENIYQRNNVDIATHTSFFTDESSISAVSRIASSYLSLLSFIDNPLIGVGQTEVYSISVAGSGVHSLHSLSTSATGIVGFGMLWALTICLTGVRGIRSASSRFVFAMLLMFGFVLLFNNSVPIYYSLIVAILCIPARKQQAPSGR